MLGSIAMADNNWQNILSFCELISGSSPMQGLIL